MKLIKWTETLLLAAGLTFGFASFSNAADTATGTVKEAARDVKKNAKQAGRAVKDEACEMVNGKCVGQKIKHKVQNGVDEVKDKTDMDAN